MNILQVKKYCNIELQDIIINVIILKTSNFGKYSLPIAFYEIQVKDIYQQKKLVISKVVLLIN